MKVCVTSQGVDLDAAVDSKFGRAQYFVVVDTESFDFELIDNANINGTGGVGVQSGKLMADRGVECVLTGNIGPNASDTLNAAGIKFCLGATGTVRETVEKYRKGGFSASQDSNVQSKTGA